MTPTSNRATAVGLGDVPPELMLEIVRNLVLSDKCHLMVTCRGMHNLIQDLLYEDDLKSPDPCALRFACVTGDVSLIEAMLDRGTPVDCVFSSYTRRKTSSGRDILCQRDRACTPLTTAVACRQLEAVKVLLRRGAHPTFAAPTDLPRIFPAPPMGCQFPCQCYPRRAAKATEEAHRRHRPCFNHKWRRCQRRFQHTYSMAICSTVNSGRREQRYTNKCRAHSPRRWLPALWGSYGCDDGPNRLFHQGRA